MRCYADTSWWLAYKCRRDTHHPVAVTLLVGEPQTEVIWTPWQRVEVFNAFYQTERAGLIRKGEARQMTRLLEQEVRLGYWPHAEFDWIDTVRTACDLTAQHSLSMTVRGMDLFHVAIATEMAVDAFLSFDDDQNALAQAAGLTLVRLKGSS